jgi:phosphoribosylformylglycinamidine synthase subunit PurSL
VLALVDNFCWPDPVSDPAKMAALVRACFGMRDAALALSAPLVSGKDSMKNDFRGKRQGQPVTISVPPTLLITAIARVPDTRLARTADFKAAGDSIYLLGGKRLSLWGSELQAAWGGVAGEATLPSPDWDEARRLYSWIGGATGKEQPRLRSLHDVSEGGLLVAVAEGLLARGLGATLELPRGSEPWSFCFGEGFHSFVASASELEAQLLEAEWAKLELPFLRLGQVTARDRLELLGAGGGTAILSVPTRSLRQAWQKAGYWE